MNLQRSAEVAQGDSDSIHEMDKGFSEIPPWLFKHQALEETLESSKTIDQKDLTNILNFIHFMDRCIYVHLLHVGYGEGILLKAYPEPCLGNEFTCSWDDKDITGITLEHYRFMGILIDDGKSLIFIPALPQSMDKESFSIQIPERSYIVGYRQERRYQCHGIAAELIQNGFQASGELVDFNPIGFRVKVTPESFSSFRWLNLDESIHANLMDNRQTIYSGVCRIIRHFNKQQGMEIILSPIGEGIKRFRKKQARNIRQRLVPSPSLVFNHPFLKKRIQLDVHDISTSGFSIYEEEGGRVLMPGMIIPGLKISFSGILNISCTGQVIYHLEEEGRGSRYGLAILDMDINSYSHLTQILTNVLEPHTYLSAEVDMDALWEFFFDTDFLYPKKYRIIQSHREAFKETYRKLYQENPDIAKHFTYQKNGRIYGHISMIRAYERTWM
ncbi:MAG TPA: PilZ domain-containing protein, partial [Desulfatiglandales bacterium]|nr:PilZ domain-containing protein [Desulfatiglandales bacterium]